MDYAHHQPLLKHETTSYSLSRSILKRVKNLCGAKPCVAATQIRFELSLGRVWNYNVQKPCAGVNRAFFDLVARAVRYRENSEVLFFMMLKAAV